MDSQTIQPVPGGRYAVLDVARGIAIILMAVYHLAWDLTFYGLARIDLFGDPFWLGLRAFIPGLFLFLAGFSQVLAHRRGFRARTFWTRTGQIAAGAGAITLATWIAFPDRFIYFSVLHGIALFGIILLGFRRWPWWSLLAVAVMIFPAREFLADPYFDAPAWHWLGLVTRFPLTNDYVPVVPWFANVLVGAAAAKLALARGWLTRPPFTLALGARPLRFLAWGGRHGLVVYLCHQPLLLALLYPIAWFAAGA